MTTLTRKKSGNNLWVVSRFNVHQLGRGNSPSHSNEECSSVEEFNEVHI